MRRVPRSRCPMLADRYLRSGKVRDLYARADGRLVLVASDRMSAFDVVLPTEIPDKGRVLTGLSRHWFATTAEIVPNHLVSTATDDPDLRGRIMVCRPTTVIPIEAVVRGYLAGSGWKEYRADGRVCAVALPPGLVESDRLPDPIFTPATKAEAGEHDENIDFETMAASVGQRRRRAGPRPCARPLSVRRGGHRARGDPAGGHEVRVRARSGDRPDPVDRRGADARIRRVSGMPRRISPAAARRASTSSSCATGWRSSRGARRRPVRRCRRRSSRGPGPGTSRRTNGSPVRASSATCRRT